MDKVDTKKNKERSDAKRKIIRLGGEKRMAVSMGVLYDVRGDVAKKMIQELDYPTPDQIKKGEELKTMILCRAGELKKHRDTLRINKKK